MNHWINELISRTKLLQAEKVRILIILNSEF